MQERAYFDGAGWRTDAPRSRAPEGLDRKIGVRFGVFPHGGRFILFTQDGEAFCDDISSFIAGSTPPPRRSRTLLCTLPEPAPDNRLYTYNATAHPIRTACCRKSS